MLESLFGSVNREKVLIFLYARDEGFPREIARHYKTDVSPIQRQLERLEEGGVLSSRLLGKTRVYNFNPRYPFLRELEQLLEKVLSFYPDTEKEILIMNRRRPRRKNKPL